MIRSCRDRETRKLLERRFSRKWQAIARPAARRLALLRAAQSLEDLKLPGLRLEALKDDRKGQYSLRINDRCRICFEWREGDAYNVEVTDYH